MAPVPDTRPSKFGNPKEDKKISSKSKTKKKTRSKAVKIISSDNVTFHVDEVSAMESCVMKNWIKNEFDGALTFRFTGEILSKVIEFCKKYAETRKTNVKHAHEKLKDFNSEFLKENQSNLIRLLHAACRLQIRSLLDLTSEAVVDMIIGKTPEEINKMFNMKQDITFEEIVQVFERDNWCFE